MNVILPTQVQRHSNRIHRIGQDDKQAFLLAYLILTAISPSLRYIAIHVGSQRTTTFTVVVSTTNSRLLQMTEAITRKNYSSWLLRWKKYWFRCAFAGNFLFTVDDQMKMSEYTKAHEFWSDLRTHLTATQEHDTTTWPQLQYNVLAANRIPELNRSRQPIER